MVDHVEGFLKVYERSVADQTSREQIVHDCSVSEGRVVAAETSLGRVQFRPTGFVEEVYKQESLEQFTVYTY